MIPFDRMCTTQKALSPAQVAQNTSAEQSFTLPGLKVGDIIMEVSKPTNQAGLGIVNARVASADTVAIAFMNNTGSGITPTAGETYTFVVLRPEKVLNGGSVLMNAM